MFTNFALVLSKTICAIKYLFFVFAKKWILIIFLTLTTLIKYSNNFMINQVGEVVVATYLKRVGPCDLERPRYSAWGSNKYNLDINHILTDITDQRRFVNQLWLLFFDVTNFFERDIDGQNIFIEILSIRNEGQILKKWRKGLEAHVYRKHSTWHFSFSSTCAFHFLRLNLSTSIREWKLNIIVNPTTFHLNSSS